MLKFLIEAFKASKGRMPNNMEMILLRQKAAKQSVDERKVVSMFDRSAVNPNKPILGGKNIPETEEEIRQRLLKNNEKGLASMKSKLEDPEKKADGGRAGFAGGGSDASTTSYSKSFDKQHGTNTASRANKSVDRRQAAGQRDADNTNRRIEANRQAGLSEIFPPKETIREKIENSRFNNPITRGLFRAGLYTLNPSLGVLDARQAMQLKNAYDLAVTGSLPNTETEETLGGIDGMTSNLITDQQAKEIDKASKMANLMNDTGKLTDIEKNTIFENAKPFDDQGSTGVFGIGAREAEPMTRDEFDNYIQEKGYATGGRIGYKLGTGKKGIEGLIDLIKNKFGKKSITTADKAPIPPKTLERDMFKKADNRINKKEGVFMEDGKTPDYDYYKEILDDAEDSRGFNVAGDETMEELLRREKEIKDEYDYMYDQYKTGKLDPEPGSKSQARLNLLKKRKEEAELTGDYRLFNRDDADELDELEEFLDQDYKRVKAEQADLEYEKNLKGLEDLGASKLAERFKLKKKYPGITDDLLDKILIDDNVQRKAEVLATIDEAFKMMEKGKGTDEILDTMKNVTRTKQADGGITRIGLKGGYLASGAKQLGKKYKGSTLSALLENPKLLGAELGHDGIMEIMNLLPSLFADGGRANFVGGGMGRRGFLKMLAGLGGGIAAAKTGLLKFAGKGAGKEVAKEVVQKSTTTPPPYFFKLAEKIKMLGNDVTATTDRTISKSLKSKDGKSEYLLEEDITSGDTIIKKINKESDEMITDVEIMDFKKGEVVIGKNGKPVKTPDNYEEVTEANARIEGDVFNDPYYTDGIEIDEIMKEVSEQAPSIKKASGGIARMLGE